MASGITPTQVKVFFDDSDLIVSKTDLEGRITFATRTCLEIAGYRRGEVIGAPHSLIRHPDMPRAVFKLLWDTLGAGHEIFAFVKNGTKRGDHYWVFAHVTPSFDPAGPTRSRITSARCRPRRRTPSPPSARSAG